MTLAGRLAGLAHSPTAEQATAKAGDDADAPTEGPKGGSGLRRTLSLERLRSRGKSKPTEVQGSDIAVAFEEVGIGFHGSVQATSPSAGSRLKARATSFMRKPKREEGDADKEIGPPTPEAAAHSGAEGGFGSRLKRRAQSFGRTPSSKGESASGTPTITSGSPLKRTESMARRVFGRSKKQDGSEQQQQQQQPKVSREDGTAAAAPEDLPESPASIVTISPGTSPSEQPKSGQPSLSLGAEELEELRSLGEAGDGFGEVEIEPTPESHSASPDKLELSESEEEGEIVRQPESAGASSKSASPSQMAAPWQAIPPWPVNPMVRAAELRDRLPTGLLAKGTGLPVPVPVPVPVQVRAYATQVIGQFEPSTAACIVPPLDGVTVSKQAEKVAPATQYAAVVRQHDEVKLSLRATSGRAVSLRLTFDPCPSAERVKPAAVPPSAGKHVADQTKRHEADAPSTLPTQPKAVSSESAAVREEERDTEAGESMDDLKSGNWPTPAEAIHGVHSDDISSPRSAQSERKAKAPGGGNKGKKGCGGGGAGGKGKGKKAKGKH